MALKLVPGLYESLINEFINAGIVEAEREHLHAESRSLDPGDSHSYAWRMRSAKYCAKAQPAVHFPRPGRLRQSSWQQTNEHYLAPST